LFLEVLFIDPYKKSNVLENAFGGVQLPWVHS
jgi:hypothetical protein